ncbi:hypothetical protein [Hymenobacter psychrotolerans]|uniref:ABC transporter ATPase n=1 Tax=Hymenobacter psychrotolerans DSM 18569 TaxID=1121959 RepID=A0A1M6Q0K4_9BACT|nr:hypothetical protein [Hymenobacter psychrotolerans]SHK13738.1 hypothetical protein SAMN02746009_00412 [Hymenobacter psychrotolerans DSM 18569]
MYVPFDQLPASARLWIYQASRPLTAAEETRIEPVLSRFAEEWTSHGRTLQASVAVLHHQFLVVGLDEAVADASGCSIDASVRFVRELETMLGLSLLEKSQLAFLVDEQVHLLDRRQLKAAIEAGQLTSTTPYFDATVSLKDALKSRFPAPAGSTWLARYFS